MRKLKHHPSHQTAAEDGNIVMDICNNITGKLRVIPVCSLLLKHVSV